MRMRLTSIHLLGTVVLTTSMVLVGPRLAAQSATAADTARMELAALEFAAPLLSGSRAHFDPRTVDTQGTVARRAPVRERLLAQIAGVPVDTPGAVRRCASHAEGSCVRDLALIAGIGRPRIYPNHAWVDVILWHPMNGRPNRVYTRVLPVLLLPDSGWHAVRFASRPRTSS